MNTVIKKIIVLFTVLISTAMLEGCEPALYGGDKRLARCVAYDAPSIDLMLATTEELERDEYGRILFKYDAGDGGHNFLGICQGYTGDTTTFYQDFCTISHVDGPNSYTEEEINRLKAQNDWGKPLNLPKMTTIDFRADSGTAMLKLTEASKKIEESGLKETGGFGGAYTDGKGNQLYYTWAEKNGEESFYFIILDKNYNFPTENAVEKMDWPDFQPQLHEFKIKNGWDFTTGTP